MQPVLFSHVLIDEAGQALPTEALIPLSLLALDTGMPGGMGPGCGAVLCGDPKQLGPVVRSQVSGGAAFAGGLVDGEPGEPGGLPAS